MYYSYTDSPIGPLLLVGDHNSLSGLYFSTGKKARGADSDWERYDAPFQRTKKQLAEYFAGRRKVFDLELLPSGTAFQLSVLNALLEIPYGETRSYADIAQHIENPKAVRAVGSANGNNPIALIIPCHRVIGSNGSLTGFGGGLESKRFLLDLETRHSGLFAD
ncbi:MAG: methylated-DNA--[protein]-cysteine S-methyltransferase [Gammaproteobacteria bacterium]|nr:methylated-DNA--[protein]-cysteine S-methyltransferase [Gammaproteobacteria bacterium]